MAAQLPSHQRIRFRRDEIVDLAALPSAIDQPPALPSRSRAGWLPRRVLLLLVSPLILIGIAWASLDVIGSSSFVSNQLRFRVEAMVRQAAGPDVLSKVGPARLTLDGSSLVALDFDDVALARPNSSQSPFLNARDLSFGLRAWPLLMGRVELASARVNGARLALDNLGEGGGDWLAVLRDDRGLIDPDRVVDATFSGLDRFVAAVRSGSTREVRFDDVALESGSLALAQRMHIATATISDSGDAIRLQGTASLDGTAFTFAVTLDVGQGEKSANAFKVTVGAHPATDGAGSAPLFQLDGSRKSATAPAQLQLAVATKDQDLELGEKGKVRGDVLLNARLVSGSGKVEIERLDLKVQRSHFAFNGAFGPAPAGVDGAAQPVYRYELVSDGSVIAPEDSPEAALSAAMRIAGTVSANGRSISLDDIGIRASSGEARGRAAIEIVEGLSPALSLDIGVEGMSVQQAKQLWPWIAAGGARRWVMNNFFGGTVLSGSVHYNMPAGRLGRGGRLSAEEVSGKFVVQGSRFDTAGLLPPIRDASGEIDFRGSEVDIKLADGTAYMTSGRSVHARNGTLRIGDASRPPIIGKMDLDIAGSADAIAELASYEPIAVLAKIGFSPEDFSGEVEGHVRADIPMTRGIDRKKLDWLVDLNYRGLALGKPLDGQLLTEASGSISIDRSQAKIAAKGKLNGIPAEIDTVRPLNGSEVERRENIQLVFDDDARQKAAPGLNQILSGPIKVKVEGSQPGQPRKVEADLTTAKIELPWIGWSKGSGIPAKATFAMDDSGSGLQIQDLRVDGKTFSARGTLSVADKTLQSARFDRVSLNGDDEIAITIKRSGKGYAISLSGSSLDARAVIKKLNDTTSKPSQSTTGSVVVDAKLNKVVGFGGEALSDVTVRYSGSGSQIGTLAFQGVTAAGGAVRIENASTGGERRISATSRDAGGLLRFLNIYGRVRGGSLQLSLAGDKTLSGRLEVRDFEVVDEPKLGSLVSAPPPGGDKSLSQATKAKIDASRVKFDRGFAELQRGQGTLRVANGVLRGPLIGTTFQGTVYDSDNNMDMTGTFMPAYGLNSIFGDIPVLGAFLGNGRDGGLIGLTYRLRGDVKAPKLEVNPLSVIAPGIFRSIFEF